MDVFSRVVVGVDGTEWGREALGQALALAPRDAVVEAVVALDTSPAALTGFDAERWKDILADEAARARDEAATILARRAQASARVERGGAVRVLRAARDEAGATLLALGARHSSRFLGIMLGATSTELLHDAVCSVLFARPSVDGGWQPRRVVVGTDGSPSARVALEVADDIRSRVEATVGIVADARDPVAALVERSREADLVVVGSRGLHGVRAPGSVSERLAHRAKCSVLVARDVVDLSHAPA